MKSGVWQTRLRLNGKNIMVYGSTRAECVRNASLIKTEHCAGKVVQVRCNYTTAQAIDAYIASRPKLSPSTIKGYLDIRDNVFREARDLPIQSVKWQSVINNDSHAPKTIKNAWGLIKSVHAFCGITPPEVALPKLVKEERPWLDQDQIIAFIEAIKGKGIETAALLALHSLRRSEILDLSYNDIDIKRGIIHVRGAAVIDKDGNLIHKTENKNASSTRDVPIMIPRLKELLQSGGDGYVVNYRPNAMYVQINRECKKAGLPEVGVHGLRHSFVSLAYHLGWSEIATMRVGGYSDYATMRKIYTHLSEADRREGIDAMTKFYS